eukprot:Gb_09809 [translate_table: standard]
MQEENVQTTQWKEECLTLLKDGVNQTLTIGFLATSPSNNGQTNAWSCEKECSEGPSVATSIYSCSYGSVKKLKTSASEAGVRTSSNDAERGHGMKCCTLQCDKAWRGDMAKMPKQAIVENGLLEEVVWRKNCRFVAMVCQCSSWRNGDMDYV